MEKQILEKLQNLKSELEIKSKQLQNSEIISDVKKLTLLNKEIKRIEPKVNLYNKYLSLKKDIEDAENIISLEKDETLINELKQLIKSSKDQEQIIEKQIIEIMIDKDPLDESDVIIEIKATVGGDEAKLFAHDLYRMYLRYASKMDWKTEVINIDESEEGGINNIEFSISGVDVYGNLKYESGVHRVQRVPTTESQGRVHTSAAAVIVIPKAESQDVEIESSDLRIDTYRSGGSGGQHANKTDSAVRITHIPTGIVTQSQDGRSQHDNKEKALTILKSKILDAKHQAEKSLKDDDKKNIIGSGDRSQKIRTYNYPQNRFTDHRINLTIKKLDKIMEGNLEEVISVLTGLGKEAIE